MRRSIPVRTAAWFLDVRYRFAGGCGVVIFANTAIDLQGLSMLPQSCHSRQQAMIRPFREPIYYQYQGADNLLTSDDEHRSYV